MQSVQWSLTESETPRRQTTETAGPTTSVPGKQASGENAQSDRQPAAIEGIYAAFVWLFGSGCF
jgi:hypothetical protein